VRLSPSPPIDGGSATVTVQRLCGPASGGRGTPPTHRAIARRGASSAACVGGANTVCMRGAHKRHHGGRVRGAPAQTRFAGEDPGARSARGAGAGSLLPRRAFARARRSRSALSTSALRHALCLASAADHPTAAAAPLVRTRACAHSCLFTKVCAPCRASRAHAAPTPALPCAHVPVKCASNQSSCAVAQAQGAYFKDVSGWEGADWFAGEAPLGPYHQ